MDGFPALAAQYTVADAQKLVAFTNALVLELVPDATGALEGTTEATGPFTIRAEYVRRGARLAVALAVLPSSQAASFEGSLVARDLAVGSALAQAAHGDAPRCETVPTTRAEVEILFVVDDSGSMASSQTALGDTAVAMVDALDHPFIDAQLGMVTTSYVTSGRANYHTMRGFTRNPLQLRAWLTQSSTCSAGVCSNVAVPAGEEAPTCTTNAQCWVSINGSGTERPLDSARAAIEALAAEDAAEPVKIRDGATVVVVLLTDTADRSMGTTPSEFVDYFRGTGDHPGVTRNALDRPIVVHAIACPPGLVCGQNEEPSDTRHVEVVEALSGVLGDIRTSASITAAVETIVHEWSIR